MAGLPASLSFGFARREARRNAQWDALMVALAAAHGVLLLTAPTLPVIALGVWWNSNTISHHFIHRPFFQGRTANFLFAAYLSVLLGIPQSLWRDRHLAHHAGISRHLRVSRALVIEVALVLSLWAVMAVVAPWFFVLVYLPGYIAGLGLCALHGFYEHARGTTSHYGKLYNILFFNDGYHAEHHANPGLHWTQLPGSHDLDGSASAWPAPLRWMEAFGLEALERVVMKSRVLQWFVLRNHSRAFRKLWGELPHIERVGVVGGGLFPRTALILAKLLPEVRITIIDGSRENLDRARALLGATAEPGRIDFVHALYAEADCRAYDLMVIPLAFDGDRAAIYSRPPAKAVIVHDWIWRKRGTSRIVSVALLKRANLVRR